MTGLGICWAPIVLRSARIKHGAARCKGKLGLDDVKASRKHTADFSSGLFVDPSSPTEFHNEIAAKRLTRSMKSCGNQSFAHLCCGGNGSLRG